MRLLSRYVLRQFFAAMGLSLLAFVMIFVVVDLIQRLDKFLDHAVAPSLIALYYLNFLPYIIVLTIPVSLLLASLFTVGQLAKYGELTAMKASGVSLYRIFIPVLGMSVLVGLLVFVAGEWVVPASNQRKERINKVYVEQQGLEEHTQREHVYVRGEGGRQYALTQYDGRQRRASGVLVVEFQDGAIVGVIRAERMDWDGNRWLLRRGTVRRFQPGGGLVAFQSFETLPRPDWNERPDDFLKEQKGPQEMNYGELKRYIQLVQRSGGDVQGYLVDLYLKFSFPCANAIIVLFGVAIASHIRKSGAAVGFALSIGICFIYWGMIRIAQALGHAGTLSPLVGAWGPNVVFGLLGLFLLFRAPK
ncbi:MAG: LptF/LptG family permease [Candidatus Latescibacteria bacterium]|nr:LptF/LptG family permease [Candidatus Latescibacterota bacterium]